MGVDYSLDQQGQPLVMLEPLRVGFTVPLVEGGRFQLRPNFSSNGSALVSP